MHVLGLAFRLSCAQGAMPIFYLCFHYWLSVFHPEPCTITGGCSMYSIPAMTITKRTCHHAEGEVSSLPLPCIFFRIQHRIGHAGRERSDVAELSRPLQTLGLLMSCSFTVVWPMATARLGLRACLATPDALHSAYRRRIPGKRYRTFKGSMAHK